MMTELQELDIPVPTFLPFLMRSSFVDQDPVLWLQILDSYILLIQKLITIYSDRHIKLTTRSQQQVTLFIKAYLFETAEESSKVFSLGSINVDIVQSSKVLKLYVFEFIKTTNLVNLNLGSDSVWDFIKIYTKLVSLNLKNSKFPVTLKNIRQLIEGSIKSKVNSRSNDVSLIKPLQTYLQKLIETGKFGKSDLEALSLLLGKYIHQSNGNKGVVKIGNRNKSKAATSDNGASFNFAEKFVNGNFIEILEVLYNKGTAVHSESTFEVAVVSCLSLPVIKISKLISVDLSVSNFKTLVRLYPLLSTIILSKAYQQMNPGLEERLPFLSKKGRQQQRSGVSFDANHIKMVIELFPQLNEPQIKNLLIQNDQNVEQVTHKLLEMDPAEFSEIEEYKPFKRSVYDGDEFSQIELESSKVIYGKKDRSLEEFNENELKQKTLTAALKLLYQSDEDEPDDTYDDQELTTGGGESIQMMSSGSDVVEDDAPLKVKINKSNANATLEMTDNYLFAIHKKTPELLQRSARKSAGRKAIRDQTKWTDEQIEGWSRLLLMIPSRFRMLEELYLFGNVSESNRNLKKSTKYRKNDTADGDDEDAEALLNERRNSRASKHVSKITPNPSNPGEGSSTKTDKQKRLRDAKKKLTKANHNRKAEHDKKMAKGFV